VSAFPRGKGKVVSRVKPRGSLVIAYRGGRGDVVTGGKLCNPKRFFWGVFVKWNRTDFTVEERDRGVSALGREGRKKKPLSAIGDADRVPSGGKKEEIRKGLCREENYISDRLRKGKKKKRATIIS